MKLTTPLKKLCLFGLAEGLGKMTIDQTDDERVFWRADKLREAGAIALDKSKIKIDKSKIRKVKDKIESVYKNQEEFNIVILLSFILSGIQDLLFYDRKNEILKLLEKRLIWFIKFYDPKLDQEEIHQEAFEKYQKWLEEI